MNNKKNENTFYVSTIHKAKGIQNVFIHKQYCVYLLPTNSLAHYVRERVGGAMYVAS